MRGDAALGAGQAEPLQHIVEPPQVVAQVMGRVTERRIGPIDDLPGGVQRRLPLRRIHREPAHPAPFAGDPQTPPACAVVLHMRIGAAQHRFLAA